MCPAGCWLARNCYHITCGGSGNELWAAWYGGDSQREQYSLYTSRWIGSQWTSETRVDTLVTSSQWFVDIAVDSNGTAHVVWEDLAPFRVYYSNNGSGEWSEPFEISTAQILGAGWAAPSIVVGPGSSLHLAWVGTEATGETVSDWDIYYSVFDGTSWRYPIRMSGDDSEKDLYPEIIVSRANKVWISWNKELAFWDYRIFGRHYDGKAWGPEVRLDDDTYEYDDSPEVAISHSDEAWCGVKPILSGNFATHG